MADEETPVAGPRGGATTPPRGEPVVLPLRGPLQFDDGQMSAAFDELEGEAHTAGLIHRDIKPDNIHLTERGGIHDYVKVLDFGLVKRLDDAAASQLTQTNTVMGTPHYMSPEAIRDPKSVDARSDLYAVGAVGYFLLTGQRLFAKEAMMEVLSSQLSDAPVRPSERVAGTDVKIEADLEAVVLRCLEKDPIRRYASADELRRALLDCASAGDWTQADAMVWWRQHFGSEPESPAPRHQLSGLS